MLDDLHVMGFMLILI